MADARPDLIEAPASPTRVFCFSLSFFRDQALRRALVAHGLSPRFGRPGPGDWVAVWGRRPVSRRGLAAARRSAAQVITLEDSFLRSVRTGREGEPGHGLIVDPKGIYFETAGPSLLQDLFDAAAEKPDPGAAPLLHRWRVSGLSKYNVRPANLPDLPDDYVLLIDQTFGDASVAGAGAHAGHFQTMLDTARAEHPGATILIKTHPETLAGKRAGFFDPRDGNAKTLIWDHGTAPRALFARARAVYCVSSLLGAEAILHGHRPVVFGDAFYCGRGLTDDRHERTPARTNITPEAFFDAAYLRYCRWHDPALGRLCTFEDVLDQLTSKMSAHKGFAVPSVLSGMRLWKRGFLKRRFDRIERFEDDPKTASRLADHAGGQIVVWAGKESTALTRAAKARKVPVLRMEDGFVRSAGLGAELVVPASLTLDDAGIYYDPSRPSRLERLIDAGRDLPPWAETRARRLADRIVAAGVSKYNLGAEAPLPEFPEGRDVVLVPGQVEDDQSIFKGAPGAATNRALLAAARGAFPGAYIVYKPHPDVLAGLRDGGESGSGFADADETVARADIAQLLPHVSRVATMTSLTGFEALLRGIPVTTWGIPFYAGWGLTDDRAETPARRRPGVPLWALVHAALIDYPAYWDPVTGLSCGPEVLLERLETGAISRAQGPGLRLLAKAQGLAASYAYLWR